MKNNSISTVNNSKSIFWIKFFVHLLVLLFIFIGPELIFSIGRNVHIVMLFTPLCYILLFYINYYCISDKFLFNKKKVWLYILINILLIFAILITFYVVESTFKAPHSTIPSTPKPDLIPIQTQENFGMVIVRVLTMLPRIGTMALLSISISILVKIAERRLRWEEQERRMQVSLQDNELKNLRNQLNPHFLFNTLNNIYALVPISQQKAQQSILDLSQMLRYSLYNTNDREVLLEKEILFIKNYVSLMRLRLNKLASLNVKIDENNYKGKRIAPLLFIPLIENAFKHGISSNKEAFIDIKISVTDTTINCHVENSYFPKNNNDKSGSGIGISNLTRQLDIIYPDSYTFNYGKKENKFITDLTISFTHLS